MKITKKNSITTVVAVGLFIIIFITFLFFITLPWSALFMGILFSEAPPKPVVTYGEFPFELVYKIDDEVITINDVYICEYDGIGANEARGKYRQWKGYVKSTGNEGIILASEGNKTVYCFVGDAEYYMDDEKYPEQTPLTPHVVGITEEVVRDEDGNIIGKSTNAYDSDEMIEHYGIEIISWEFSDPIENSFE